MSKTKVTMGGGESPKVEEISDENEEIYMASCDVILDNGELVSIKYQINDIDRFYDSFGDAVSRRDWWCKSSFENCKITFKGISLERVNCAKVLGLAG